ncbi:MAG: DUF1648 domain-containing protein [Proteiniphilum sp.]|jgi:hypothetical protein|uniref:DUF1648 domain-containing protein n=1 Tax=Proteiniphilum sp. TaxID=1926877 RepID=UPI00092CC7FC|nr:DUF1648 domain-containing protein [Proteiniphilum sp.]MEA5129272.1 DUF1648 domain-containing protein [Proteiniphilum sp.]OJV84926.1 MAG: hypothetical protein BGO34_14325 [Bacteroidia bacterium 44-10]
MKNRPEVKINFTTTDKIIEIISWMAVVGTWVLTFFNYEKLPEQIPVYYNGVGETDGFGDKSHIFILPIVATLIFTGLTIPNKYPRIFNFFVSIPQENAFWRYPDAVRLIRSVKLLFVVVLGLIVFMAIQKAKGTAGGSEVWFLPMTVGLFFMLIMYCYLKIVRR